MATEQSAHLNEEAGDSAYRTMDSDSSRCTRRYEAGEASAMPFELARMSLTRRSRPRRSDLFFALLLAFALGGSPGCVWRIPLNEYVQDFAPGVGLDGCPDLAGTYVATGQGSDYLLTFPFYFILPIWWGRNPAPPRLDMDLALGVDDDVRLRVEGAEQVVLAQPDADHLVITLLDDSGRAIENFEEIVFVRHRGGTKRKRNWERDFSCSGDGRLVIEWSWGADGAHAFSGRMLGRLPDGNLVVRAREERFMLSGLIDTRSQLYERVFSSNPSP